MKQLTNHCIEGSRKRPIVMDIYWPEIGQDMPVAIFAHGYKGFKDWGAWELMADHFTNAGMVFIKFNFSFNGGTKEDPIDFPDLEAFAENNFTTELNDLGMLLDWIDSTNILPKSRMNKHRYLIGHSRGGGVAILRAREDERISKLVTWAAISDIEGRFPKGEALKEWEENGFQVVYNSRTKQDMRVSFQLYEDWSNNQSRLNIINASKKINVPWLIIHGQKDSTVLPSEAKKLKRSSRAAMLKMIDQADHTFNSKHPWESQNLSPSMEEALTSTIEFFSRVR